MDEAFVVLVASDSGVCQAFPFATKAGAKAANEFFHSVFAASVRTCLIDDHEDSPEHE